MSPLEAQRVDLLFGPRSRQHGRAQRRVEHACVAPARAAIASGAGETGFDDHRRRPQETRGETQARRGAARAAAGSSAARSAAADRRPHRRPADCRARALRRGLPAAGRRRRAGRRGPSRIAFEPLGIRLGAFLVKPSIEVTRGHDSNPARTPAGKSSDFTLVAPELQVRSQWSVHEWGASLRGSYSTYDQLPSSDRPLVDARTFSRFDVVARHPRQS